MAATLGGHPRGLSLTAVSTAAGFRVAGQKTITIAGVRNSASRDPYSSREAKREAHQKARKGHHQFARSRLPDPTPSSRASDHAETGRNDEAWNACPCCGGRMIIIETFEPGCQPRLWPLPSIGLDSS